MIKKTAALAALAVLSQSAFAGPNLTPPAYDDYADRLALQHQVDYGVPLSEATWIGTHNSFNATESGGTTGYAFPNHRYDMRTQLNYGARALSFDLHYYESNDDVLLCHAYNGLVCSPNDDTFLMGLNEVAGFINSNPDEVVMIVIQNELSGSAAFSRAVNDIEASNLVNAIYQPSDYFSGAAGFDTTCDELPLNGLTKQDVLDAGKNVILVTAEGCSNDDPNTFGNLREYAWDLNNFSEGTGVLTARSKRFPSTYSIVAEDRLRLPLYTKKPLSGQQLRQALKQGAGILALDFMIDEQRFEDTIWSWAADQPSNSGNCAASRVNNAGKWQTNNCTSSYKFACVNTVNGEWKITNGKAAFSNGAAQCQSEFGSTYAFGLPHNAGVNEKLRLKAIQTSESSFWINYDRMSDGLTWQTSAPFVSGFETLPSGKTTTTHTSSDYRYSYKVPESTTQTQIKFTVKGGDGGSVKINRPGDNKDSHAYGGAGNKVEATFTIGDSHPHQIPKGAILTFIAGGAGENVSYDITHGEAAAYSRTAGGGGGSAVVMTRPDGSTEVLLVAGGGGGAYAHADQLFFNDDNGGSEVKMASSGATGGGSGSGKSGGGGGFLGAGGGSGATEGGKPGRFVGGAGASSAVFGGRGFGGGGGGNEAVLQSRGGGGGGGYRGGNGGDAQNGGDAGYSYVIGGNTAHSALQGQFFYEVRSMGSVAMGQNGSVSFEMGNNIALNKPTQMSNVYSSLLSPEKAVNGDTRGTNAVGDLAHSATAEVGNWWQVDLGQVYQLETSRWYNRADCCAHRMANYEIKGSLDGQNWYQLSSQTTQMGRPTVINHDQAARYVRLVQRDSQSINFSEVEISGTPADSQKLLANGVTVGQVSITQNASDQWQYVEFENEFTDTPIVVVGPVSHEGSDPSYGLIRNVTSEGFEIQLKEWDYLDGSHSTVSLDYIAAEEGVHNLGGLKLHAQSTSVDHNFASVSFNNTFLATPAVFAQLQTTSGYQSAVPRMQSVAINSVQVRLQEQEADDGTHAFERVNVISVSQGNATISGKKMRVKQLNTDHNAKSVSFGSTYRAPLVFSNIQTFAGSDTAAVRSAGISPTQAFLKVEEEASFDAETDHALETLSVMVIER